MHVLCRPWGVRENVLGVCVRMMTYQDYEKERREFLAFVNSLPHCEVFNENQEVYKGEKLKYFEGVYEEVANFLEFYRG